MAPSITNARLGSQRPVTSRNPRTLSGFVMPESPSPTAKTTPARNAAARPFTTHLQERASPRTW